MDQVRLRINKELADYQEIEGLPVSFKIQTDEFSGIAAPKNSQIDNVAKRLALPSTRNNQRIVSPIEGGLVGASLTVNGSLVFEGNARHVQTEYKAGSLLGYAFEMNSGAKALFESLGSRTLRGLDLGNTEYSLENIEASWAKTGANDLAVWAPVYYGETGDADNNFTPSLLRPHVFFKTITDVIFKDLGVSVESQFFNTDFFRRFTYLFGVGEKWSVSGNAAQQFHVSTGFSTTANSGVPAFIDFVNEFLDTGAIVNGDVATLSGGVWDFQVLIPTVTNAIVRFEIPGFYTQVLQQQQLTIIGPLAVPTGSVARISVEQIDQTQPGVVDIGPFWKGDRQEDPGIGQDVRLSSCLHGEKIITFLESISHMFNLAWYYDPVFKKLHVDPRFDFTLGGVNYEGFYKRIIEGTSDWVDRLDTEQVTTQRGLRPFGDYLTLSTKAESSNWFDNAENKGSYSDIPLGGARFNFSPTGNDGSTSENPMFETLLLTGFANTSTSPNIAHMPCVVPDTDTPSTVPDPTYESGPKYGYYAGDIDNYSPWKWNGSDRSARPVIYQTPKITNSASVTVATGYNDYLTNTGPGLTTLPGLVSIFYPKWLAIMERGLVLSAMAQLEFFDINPSADVFRESKVVRYSSERKAFIFVKADGFQPLKGRGATVTMFEHVEPTQEDIGRLVSNTQEVNTNLF